MFLECESNILVRAWEVDWGVNGAFELDCLGIFEMGSYLFIEGEPILLGFI